VDEGSDSRREAGLHDRAGTFHIHAQLFPFDLPRERDERSSVVHHVAALHRVEKDIAVAEVSREFFDGEESEEA
jgi:hypothetical protein